MSNVRSGPSRRDFLKLAALAPAGMAAQPLLRTPAPQRQQGDGRQNVLVVVFDALSASNLPMYGYGRNTTPNLAALAKRAIVYHNHIAGGNFTTPGTASLLTGTLPWTNRAMPPGSGVSQPFVTRNFFAAFADYHRVAYAHTAWAYTLLRQFRHHIDGLIPRETLLLASYATIVQAAFTADQDVASVSWERALRSDKYGYAYSLFLSRLQEAVLADKVPLELQQAYPRGVPLAGGDAFLLEHAVDWISDLLLKAPQPFIGYFHFFPPHAPYNTSAEFYNWFSGDNFRPIRKPIDAFSLPKPPDLNRSRREYDEYVLYADREFGRLYDVLGESGMLENTWLVVTSDHGELFERGFVGHGSDSLYQPVIHIPLMIFEPGRRTGMDIRSPTSAVDVLPTLAHVTGRAVPDWCEGAVLEPFAASRPAVEREVFSVRSTQTGPESPLIRASIVLVKGKYKLHYYVGYPDRGFEELVKLYDLDADPEELEDLATSRKDLAAELLDALKRKLADVNEPYTKAASLQMSRDRMDELS